MNLGDSMMVGDKFSNLGMGAHTGENPTARNVAERLRGDDHFSNMLREFVEKVKMQEPTKFNGVARSSEKTPDKFLA